MLGVEEVVYVTVTLTEITRINNGFPHWHVPRNLSFMKNLTLLKTLEICHPCSETSKKISEDKRGLKSTLLLAKIYLGQDS